MRVRVAGFLCAALMCTAVPGASAGTREDPEVRSPQGSTHTGMYISTGAQDRLGSADASTVDVRSAWFEAFHDGDGHLAGFQVTLRIWGDVDAAVEGTEYTVSWSGFLGCDERGLRATLTYTVGSQPSGLHDCGSSIHASAGPDGASVQSGCRCTPFEVSDFEAAGDEIRWTLSLDDLLAADGEGGYYPGSLLSDIRVQTAAYGDGIYWVGDDVRGDRGFIFGDLQDTTPPEFGFTTEDGSLHVRETLLQGWATDDLAGVARVRVEFVKQPAAVLISRYTATLDCPETRRACDWSVNLRYQAPGTYEVRVEATDLAGNVTSEGPTLRVTVV